jgi:Uncharacterized protein conserved in bacteria (DUF2329)
LPPPRLPTACLQQSITRAGRRTGPL